MEVLQKIQATRKEIFDILIDSIIAECKMDCGKEITLDDFKDDVEDFLENINQLTIFQNIGEDLINCYIITLCIDEIANNYLYPIIKGEYNNSIFESEDDFNILRTEMFKKLADKYLDL